MTREPQKIVGGIGVPAPVVELRNVSVWFGSPSRVTIVTGLTVSVEKGAWHCIAGRSGSGKTSLLQLVGGLTDPNAGEVMWGGQSIQDWSADRRAKKRRTWMGYMDQSASALEGFTAMENVLIQAAPARRDALPIERAEALLTQVGLAERRQHRAELLSGGERQRLSLARALLVEPAILVLDEPTASLDRVLADRVIAVLGEYVADGRTVICASHDPRVIEAANSVTQLD